MDKQQMTAWLEAKAQEYTRKHEFALQALFNDVMTALNEDVDLESMIDAFVK